MVEGDDLTNHIVRLANVISDPTIDDNALDQAIHWWWLPTGAHDTVTAFFLASLCNRLLESEHYLPRIQPSDVFVDANPVDWYAAHHPAPPALPAGLEWPHDPHANIRPIEAICARAEPDRTANAWNHMVHGANGIRMRTLLVI